MVPSKVKEAIREAITNHIPFSPPLDVEYAFLLHALTDIASELGYIKAYPSAFKDRAWTFHVSAETGLRWGYVRHERETGWFEVRETTPIPDRACVMRDSEPIFGHRVDLKNQQVFQE